MKNKIGIVDLFIVLFLTFGITYIDGSDLSIGNNIKPYLMIVFGLAGLIVKYLLKKS